MRSLIKRKPKETCKRELVDEAFLEQKDVLLEMLETKLKEVRDKKKKKKSTEKFGPNSSEPNKCETSSRDTKLVMKANGISNVGALNLLMNHGKSGRGNLKLDADGISNVGRAHLNMGMEGGVNVPGISDSLIAALPRLNNIFCNNQEPTNEAHKELNKSEVAPTHSNETINIGEKTLRKSDANNTNNYVNRTDVNTTKVDVNTIKLNTNITTIDVNDINTSKNNVTASTSTGNVTTLVNSLVPSVTVSEGSVTVQSNLNTIT